MNRQFNIQLISKLKKPNTGNNFVDGLFKVLSIILYPIFFFAGLLLMIFAIVISLFQRRPSEQSNKESENPLCFKSQDKENEWTTLVERNNVKIFQKFNGEIRFGPVYLKLRSEPVIEILNEKLFGDWFFCYGKGIFLQQWNTTDEPNTNLIFVDTDTLESKVIRRNIPAVHWEIVENENKNLKLIYHTGSQVLSLDIDLRE